MEGFQYPPRCSIKMADGTDCPIPAAHFWGPVGFCCAHFDAFALTILRLRDLPAAYVHSPRHIDIVEEYNRQCGRTSLIPGAKCEFSD